MATLRDAYAFTKESVSVYQGRLLPGRDHGPACDMACTVPVHAACEFIEANVCYT